MKYFLVTVRISYNIKNKYRADNRNAILVSVYIVPVLLVGSGDFRRVPAERPVAGDAPSASVAFYRCARLSRRQYRNGGAASPSRGARRDGDDLAARLLRRPRESAVPSRRRRGTSAAGTSGGRPPGRCGPINNRASPKRNIIRSPPAVQRVQGLRNIF